MPSTLQDFKAELFKALANPVRIRILEELRLNGDLTVGELQQRVGVEPSNVSQHLALLRRSGLVATSREGTSIRYTVANSRLFELLDAARSLFEQQLADQARMLQST